MVATAHDGATPEWPDVLLVDLVLPDGSGLELVRELKAIRPVRAVAFSGLGAAKDMRGAAEAGFDAHVTKPATMDELNDALRRACRELPNWHQGASSGP